MLWSPNGEKLASVATFAGAVYVNVWNRDKNPISFFGWQLTSQNFSPKIAWHPNNAILACFSSPLSNQNISILDADSQKVIEILKNDNMVGNTPFSKCSLAWSSDGKKLASFVGSGHRDNSIRLWNMENLKQNWAQKINQQRSNQHSLPKWLTKIIPKIPSKLFTSKKSLFDSYAGIPGPILEYAIEKEPKKITGELFEGKTTETFEFVSME